MQAAGRLPCLLSTLLSLVCFFEISQAPSAFYRKYEPLALDNDPCRGSKMSFGFSPSDIITLITLTNKVYNGYRSAGSEYNDVTHTLKSFEVLLHHTNRRLDTLSIGGRRQGEIDEVVKGCQDAVRELQAVAKRYKRLSRRDRLALGMKDLRGPKDKLARHVALLSPLLTMLEIESLDADVAQIPDMLNEMPDRILERLPAALGFMIDARIEDSRSARSSVMTTYGDDDKRAYRELRRNLREVGVRDADVRKQKGPLIEFLRTLTGCVTEHEPTCPCPSAQLNAEPRQGPHSMLSVGSADQRIEHDPVIERTPKHNSNATTGASPSLSLESPEHDSAEEEDLEPNESGEIQLRSDTSLPEPKVPILAGGSGKGQPRGSLAKQQYNAYVEDVEDDTVDHSIPAYRKGELKDPVLETLLEYSERLSSQGLASKSKEKEVCSTNGMSGEAHSPDINHAVDAEQDGDLSDHRDAHPPTPMMAEVPNMAYAQIDRGRPWKRQRHSPRRKEHLKSHGVIAHQPEEFDNISTIANDGRSCTRYDPAWDDETASASASNVSDSYSILAQVGESEIDEDLAYRTKLDSRRRCTCDSCIAQESERSTYSSSSEPAPTLRRIEYRALTVVEDGPLTIQMKLADGTSLAKTATNDLLFLRHQIEPRKSRRGLRKTVGSGCRHGFPSITAFPGPDEYKYLLPPDQCDCQVVYWSSLREDADQRGFSLHTLRDIVCARDTWEPAWDRW